jgi:dolichyl-phosphate-mannose--protein O-mannosyl transferase
MTKQELIDHLQHLEKYTHYSEDAPALREVIEMLRCSEMPNGSEEHTQERTETHACDLISRQAAIAEFSCCELTPDGGIDANYAIDFLEQLPSAQPEIIYCKDCKWFGRIGCAISIVDDSDKPTENDFCSFAERKEE